MCFLFSRIRVFPPELANGFYHNLVYQVNRMGFRCISKNLPAKLFKISNKTQWNLADMLKIYPSFPHSFEINVLRKGLEVPAQVCYG